MNASSKVQPSNQPNTPKCHSKSKADVPIFHILYIDFSHLVWYLGHPTWDWLVQSVHDSDVHVGFEVNEQDADGDDRRE